MRIVDIFLFPMRPTWFSPTSQCITYDVLKCVPQVVFTSTTLYPISFAQNFAPLTYVCKVCRFNSTLGVYKGVIVTMNIMNIIIIIDGPMKTLINHTSRLLT